MNRRFITAISVLTILSVLGRDARACHIAPTADIRVREHVVRGRSVVLDGSGSYAATGEHIVEYEWDFDGDDSYDYFETIDHHPDGAFDGITTHVFTESESCTVKLRVTDSDGDPGTTSKSVNVSADDDNDGMPNAWEDLYGLDPYNPADALTSADNDNYDNLCEYFHMTSPVDEQDKPEGSDYNITLYIPGEVGSIQSAIDGSINGDTILVEKGRYHENIDFHGTNIILTSINPNDPHVVAGTVIDGGGFGPVVTFETSVDESAELTGFTITGGSSERGGGVYCESGTPTISNCVIKDNQATNKGGGLSTHSYYSSPTITNCVFSGNTASSGGGMSISGDSDPKLTNCVFADNTSLEDGGAIYNDCGFPNLINCTFSGNTATNGDAGGIYNKSGATATVTNCIFWGNQADGSNSQMYDDATSSSLVSYCVIEPGGYNGTGSDYMSYDPPEFIEPGNPAGDDGVFGTLDDGLLVWIQGPCIDVADSTVAPSEDLTGRVRLDVPYINEGNPEYHDIGAYESPVIWFVDKTAPGLDDGTSWDDAYLELRDAIDPAVNQRLASNHELWVVSTESSSPYLPEDPPSPEDVREATFGLVSGVAVYGGFTGTEKSRLWRDWKSNETILSGDRGTEDNNLDNCYHVVTGANGAILDGFTIRDGNADDVYPDNKGAGIYCFGVSPTISNCTIRDNDAGYNGAGMYNYHCSPKLTNCTFDNNEALGSGGQCSMRT